RTSTSSTLPSLTFFLLSPRPLRDLHSLPTRRSSDLSASRAALWLSLILSRTVSRYSAMGSSSAENTISRSAPEIRLSDAERNSRSEEHTSELQSRFDLVCRLLLEKKNNKNNKI